MKKLFIYISTILLSLTMACNDLSEDVFSTIVEEDFYQTEKQVLSATGPAYTALQRYTQVDGIWGLNEFTSDEAVLPTRGRHWYNDGMYQRYQKHEWHTEEGNTNVAWSHIFNGINICNRLLYQFEQVEDKSDALISTIGELRGLRAFWYFTALDMFGNVPLVTSFANAEGAPSNNTQAEVFNFVEEELLDVIPQLNAETNAGTYGRFHQWAAYATLAKLYMNAEVYTGNVRWQDALNALDEIINSAKYSLSDDYFTNFEIENEGSSENIMVVPYDINYTTTWGNMHQPQFWTLHFVGNRAMGMQQGGWNGFGGGPQFVQSYDDFDSRKGVWLIGLQLSESGDTLRCNQELAGQPLVYTVDISSVENALENEGARLQKYNYTNAEGFSLSNDFAIFRYSDVLLLKAEALMRLNGGTATQEAVDLVNQVRLRAFRGDEDKLLNIGDLTLESLLAERGWELAGEGWRRHDQIRFGVFTSGSWDFKDPSPETRVLFPIPQQQINANPNLKQNPGY